MFKKSDNQGDRTPKQEKKDPVSKTAEASGQTAPKVEEAATPANEDKKS